MRLTRYLLAWETYNNFDTPPLDSPQNDILGMNAEIAYWWDVTTQIWVLLLIGWSRFPSPQQNQSEAQLNPSNSNHEEKQNQMLKLEGVRDIRVD